MQPFYMFSFSPLAQTNKDNLYVCEILSRICVCFFIQCGLSFLCFFHIKLVLKLELLLEHTFKLNQNVLALFFLVCSVIYRNVWFTKMVIIWHWLCQPHSHKHLRDVLNGTIIWKIIFYVWFYSSYWHELSQLSLVNETVRLVAPCMTFYKHRVIIMIKISWLSHKSNLH